MMIRVLWVVREELSVEDSFQQTELTKGRSDRVLGRCREGLLEKGGQPFSLLLLIQLVSKSWPLS